MSELLISDKFEALLGVVVHQSYKELGVVIHQYYKELGVRGYNLSKTDN